MGFVPDSNTNQALSYYQYKQVLQKHAAYYYLIEHLHLLLCKKLSEKNINEVKRNINEAYGQIIVAYICTLCNSAKQLLQNPMYR